MEKLTNEEAIWHQFTDGLLRYDEALYNLLVAGCSEQTAKNILSNNSAPLPCNVVEIDVDGIVSICCSHCGEELLQCEPELVAILDIRIGFAEDMHVCDDVLNAFAMAHNSQDAMAHNRNSARTN